MFRSRKDRLWLNVGVDSRKIVDSGKCFKEGGIGHIAQLHSWIYKDEPDYLANFVCDLRNEFR